MLDIVLDLSGGQAEDSLCNFDLIGKNLVDVDSDMLLRHDLLEVQNIGVVDVVVDVFEEVSGCLEDVIRQHSDCLGIVDTVEVFLLVF